MLITSNFSRNLPVLRTVQPLRPRTQRQGLLCLQKRNCDVPDNAIALDPSLVERNFQLFKQAYLPDVDLIALQSQPIKLDEKNVLEWMIGTKPKKLQRLGQINPIQDEEWGRYQMMIKPEPKNKLEFGATREYFSLQNIVHNIPKLTAFWSSIFKELYRRLKSILKQIFVLIRKNADDISIFFLLSGLI